MGTYSFQIREEQIKLQIDDTHAPYGDPFDTNSLFIIVANILKRSTKIVEAFVEQGDVIKVSLENKEDQDKPEESFRVPMCILKNIGCELFSCKDTSAETAHETTLKILKKLQNYPWEAKVMLTLAAFAKEFGDLLHLDQVINTQDQLTKSLAILKGSLILPNTPPEKRQRRRSAVLELNNLIKETLSVIEIIIRESEKSYSSSQRIAELLKPINVYWIVMTVIACANKVTILTSEELEKPLDLSFYERKIREYKSVLIRLIGHKEVEKPPFEQPKVVEPDEREYYELLKVLVKIPTEFMGFLRRLLTARDSEYRVQLIDCSNNYITVDIDVLRKKKLFFVVSWLGQNEISDADLNILKLIQSEKIKRESTEYAIVWVPIAEESWHDQYNFERLLRFKDIQWFTVNTLALRKGSIRFLKEEWHFETSPIFVVADVAQGKIENIDAFYAISLLGLEAFPFDKETVRIKFEEMSWIHTFFKGFLYQIRNLVNWVENNKYIILHGGIDQEWAKEIEAKVNFISREANIKIELFNINQLNLEAFWSSVHTLLSKLYTGKYAKKQVERLYSYKQAKGWFFLNKGSTTVVVGSRESFLKAVAEFDKWKVDIRRRTLEVAFKEYHESIIIDLSPGPITMPPPVTVPPESRKYINGCLIIENPSLDGKLLKQMNCPTCTLDMEMNGVTYRCCHTSKSSSSYY